MLFFRGFIVKAQPVLKSLVALFRVPLSSDIVAGGNIGVCFEECRCFPLILLKTGPLPVWLFSVRRKTKICEVIRRDFMKLSTRSRYGLRMMIELAVRADLGRPILLKEISAAQEISEKYLSKLVIPLKTRGLIVSERGAKGGYNLARKASDINVYEIVLALEGHINVVDCGSAGAECPRSIRGCVAKDLWGQLDVVIKDFLMSKKLDVLADIESDARSAGMYHI